MPSRLAASAVARQWFDCAAPQVITVLAPDSRAAPRWNSSFLTLFPDSSNPARSSRFSQILGPRPSLDHASVSRGAGSSGVGRVASSMREPGIRRR